MKVQWSTSPFAAMPILICLLPTLGGSTPLPPRSQPLLLAIGQAGNSQTSTPLIEAVKASDLARVVKLLEEGARVDAPDDHTGATALVVAMFVDNVDIAKALLSHQANPNTQTKEGLTPLYIAVSLGHEGLVNLLLDHGADPNQKSPYGSPEDVALSKGYLGIVAALQKHGGTGSNIKVTVREYKIPGPAPTEEAGRAAERTADVQSPSHPELISESGLEALRRQRHFTEFSLSKAEGFTRVGDDMSLRLVMAAAVSQTYTIEVLVDHRVISKPRRTVNEVVELYQPVGNPYELVVTKIEPGQIRGYLFEPAPASPPPPLAKPLDTAELEALRALGKRRHIEFSLTRTAAPQRVGDVLLLLVKTDVLRQTFTLDVVAGDRRIAKADRAVNSPIQFYVGEARQPYELVVTKVGGDWIEGFLSAPDPMGPAQGKTAVETPKGTKP